VPRFAIFLLLASVLFASPARGALGPAEVAIVAARGNAESEQLAAYYAKARGIPAEHICRIDVPAGDDCPRDAWSTQVRPAVAQWLAENDPQHKVRCLVTVWGVPLTIGAAATTPELRTYQRYLAGERSARLASMRDTVAALDAIAPAGEISTDSVGRQSGGAAAGPAEDAPAGSPLEVTQVSLQIERAV
jgi:hypothetical protein